jgi:hypothetical protein
VAACGMFSERWHDEVIGVTVVRGDSVIRRSPRPSTDMIRWRHGQSAHTLPPHSNAKPAP